MGVYLVDDKFRIRAVNPTAWPVFGDIPDLIGRDFGEVIHTLWQKEYADEIAARFRHTLETGEPYVVPERVEERRDRGVTESARGGLTRIPLPEDRCGGSSVTRRHLPEVTARASPRRKRTSPHEESRSQGRVPCDARSTELLRSPHAVRMTLRGCADARSNRRGGPPAGHARPAG